MMDPRGQRVVVTGAGGQLGGYLETALRAVGAAVIGLGHRAGPGVVLAVDIADVVAVRTALRYAAPDAVIHAAALTDVDGCERDPARAEAVNALGSRHVADAAREMSAYLLAVGTDFVFPGDGGAPYGEEDPPRPLSVYGQTKLAGERAVLAADPAFAVARTAWLYGGAGKHFPRTVLTLLRDRGGLDVVADEFGNPTFAGDLAAALARLVTVRATGILHLVNEGRASRYELATAVAEAADLDPTLVRPTTRAEFLAKYPLPAARPADSSLRNDRAAALGVRLRPWREAIVEYGPTLAAELGLNQTTARTAGGGATA
jgi:dTDP-4-dehydrorhamnose reductase